MKRFYYLFIGFFFLSFLFSCSNPGQEDSFYTLLEQYNSKNSLKISEETACTTKSGVQFKANRITSVFLEDYYFNSNIALGQESGYVYYTDKKYYYSLGDAFKQINYTTTDNVYQATGLSSIFSEKDFTIKKGIATKKIKAPNVKKYDDLFKNVNLDLNHDYKYDTVNSIDIEIQFTEDEITCILIDLSNPFSYNLAELTRKISFEEIDTQRVDRKDEIHTKLENLVNTDYIVKTDATLNTYMIEMCYQYGDSIFIKSGDFDMLIDSGQKSDGKNVNAIIQKYCTDKILDVLIATHGHGDHVGGFAGGALDGIQTINLIIDYGYYSTDEYCSIRNSYIEKGTDYYSAYDCVEELEGASQKYKFSEDLFLEVLDTKQYAPKGERITYDANENDYSVVLKLTFKNNTYLYTGDISGDDGIFEEALLKQDIKDITVYKAAHHGSRTHNTNSERFLNYINPEICLVSAAIVDPYNPHNPKNADVAQHPSYEFVARILNTPKIKQTKALYFNGTMGTIWVQDDGQTTPIVSGFGAVRGYYDGNTKVQGEQNLKFIQTKFYQGWVYSN